MMNRIRHKSPEGRADGGRSESDAQDGKVLKDTPNNEKSVDVLGMHLGYEFGGPLGALVVVIASPLIIFYLWACIYTNEGHALYPKSPGDIPSFVSNLADTFNSVLPTKWHYLEYGTFILAEFAMAWVMPGINVLGQKIKLGGSTQQLSYKCNAYSSWYLLLAIITVAHLTGIYNLERIVEDYPQYMIAASVMGIATSVITYVLTLIQHKGVRMSGNHIYDFFVGAPLNPRIGPVDLKIFAEIRISWPLLFMISLSSLLKSYSVTGRFRQEIINILIGHFLYANACAKGENYIPPTWDITYEKWGYMVIFWNIAGVPFLYGLCSYYLSATETGRALSLPSWFLYTVLAVLIASYYLWDVSIAQKSHFRQSQEGLVYERRKTMWNLPFSNLKSYDYIDTSCGSKLLISGLWRYARKPHYTLDLITMITWALNTGFDAFVPYFQPIFFFVMLIHRQSRDEKKCKAKYESDWEAYKRAVPYKYIPYVY